MANNAAKLISTAERLLDEGKIKKAIRAYQKLLRVDPDNLRVQLKLAELYLKSELFEDACDLFLRVAQSYVENGNALKAITVFNQVLQIRPHVADIRISLASTYQRVGLLNDAATQYGLAISLLDAPEHTTLRLHTIRAMLDLDPSNAPMRLRLAEEFSQTGLIDEAATEFERVCDILRERGNKDDFLQVAERLLFHRPTDVDMCKELAGLYLEQNYPQRALPKLHICYKSRPRDTDVLEMLANVFGQLRQIHKATVILKELARIYDESGLRQERDNVLETILTLDPGNAEAKAALASDKAFVPKTHIESELIFDEEAFLAKADPPEPPPPVKTPSEEEEMGFHEETLPPSPDPQPSPIEIAFENEGVPPDANYDSLFEGPFSEDEMNVEDEEFGFDDDSGALSGPPVNLVVEEADSTQGEDASEPVANALIEVNALLEPEENTGAQDVTIDEPVIIATPEDNDVLRFDSVEIVSEGPPMPPPISETMRRESPSIDGEDTTLNDPIVTAKPDPEDMISIDSDSAPGQTAKSTAVKLMPDNILVMDPEAESRDIATIAPTAANASTTPEAKDIMPPELPPDDSSLEESPGSAPVSSVDLSGEIQELDFFLDEGMHSEASFLFSELLEKYPDHPDLMARASQIQNDSP